MKARLALKVRAGARQTGFSGKVGETWKLQVAAPPVDGKANEAILRYLAKLFSVSVSSVRIVTGFGTPLKVVEMDGVASTEAERVILESHGHRSHSGNSAPGEA